jgi:hypothetical protein
MLSDPTGVRKEDFLHRSGWIYSLQILLLAINLPQIACYAGLSLAIAESRLAEVTQPETEPRGTSGSAKYFIDKYLFRTLHSAD